MEFDPCDVLPLAPMLVDTRQFDLFNLGRSEARYVRTSVLSLSKEPPSAGFD